MATATFPLGLALADNPQDSMLQVRLFENTPPVGGFTALSQFVELSAPSYQCSRPADWYDADVISENWVYRASKKIDFRMTTDSPGKVAKGFYVTIFFDGAVHVLHWEAFGQPVPMEKVNDNVIVQARLNAYDVASIPT